LSLVFQGTVCCSVRNFRWFRKYRNLAFHLGDSAT
jgi:hypothetical protein